MVSLQWSVLGYETSPHLLRSWRWVPGLEGTGWTSYYLHQVSSQTDTVSLPVCQSKDGHELGLWLDLAESPVSNTAEVLCFSFYCCSICSHIYFSVTKCHLYVLLPKSIYTYYPKLCIYYMPENASPRRSLLPCTSSFPGCFLLITQALTSQCGGVERSTFNLRSQYYYLEVGVSHGILIYKERWHHVC